MPLIWVNGATMPFSIAMKATTYPTTPTCTSALWLSDLHLDKTDGSKIRRLQDQIEKTSADCLVITGDISIASSLPHHLRAIAAVCRSRPVYFVTGNHDYFGSSFAAVDRTIASLCEEMSNLHFMNGKQIIPLNRDTCLIGLSGWPDARAGYGSHSFLRSPDHWAISDFSGLTRIQCMMRMQELGKDSAGKIRRILPLALTRFRHVILLTHVPPFPEAVRFNDAPCGPLHLPHYANLSAGLAIRGIANAFPRRRITILAGHAHSSTTTHISSNICVRVAHARTGRIGPQEIIDLT